LFFVFPNALLARLAIHSETLTPGSSASELQSRTWDYPLRNFLPAIAGLTVTILEPARSAFNMSAGFFTPPPWESADLFFG